MELSIKDKFMKVFLTKKNFVVYILEKQVKDMEISYKSSQQRFKEAEEMFASAIQKTKQSEIDNALLEDRNLTLSVLIEGKSEEYKSIISNKKESDANVQALALIMEELIEEQVRNEEALANNQHSIKTTNGRIRDMRRTLNELRSSTNELLQRLNELQARKEMVGAMDKTQVGLEVLESKNFKETAVIADKILEAHETQQTNWRENRDLTNTDSSNHLNAVQDRMNQVLGETTRKALK